MDIILLPGLWLESSAWNEVATELRKLGHNPIQVALPGVDDRDSSATLDDQVAAVVAAVDRADSPIVVGHSAASTLAWIAADRRPDAVRSAVLVGGFPAGDGDTYAEYFEIVDGVMPFPGWGPFEGPDSDDLDDAAKEAVAAGAVPVAEGVARGTVQLGDDRRYDVPVVMVCPEYSPDDVRTWLESGDLPELAGVRNVSYVDIDTGHWPMFSAPVVMARVLDGVASAD